LVNFQLLLKLELSALKDDKSRKFSIYEVGIYMENNKINVLENKINELTGKELHFQDKLLNTLTVHHILIIAEEIALEWQSLIRSEHLDQNKKEIQQITSFFLQAFHLRNLFLEAKSRFVNITLGHIRSKEDDLGFSLLKDQELSEITEELTSTKQNIKDAIDLLSNERVADSLCLNYNEMNLHNKLIELG
jgi:hypothetical protein